MGSFLFGLDTLINALRGAFFGFALFVGLFCALDWMVRTRRINPFGSFAAFLRGTIRPFMAPIERRIIRGGGNPQAAPWWTLLLVVVAGIVILSLLDFVREQVAIATALVTSGPRGAVALAISWVFAVLRLALFVRILLSWIRPNPFAWYVRLSYVLTEWMLRPLRGIIPLIGMVDISPIIAYLLLNLAQGFLMRLA